jgi:zona occludens toxin
MPINAFGGGPGTGKTYGVMEHVILPAVSQGRFVLTNIEGLNEQAIYDYVAEHFYKGQIICVGHIRRCDRNAPEDEDFFPGESMLDKPVLVPAPDFGRVAGGDLVVIDEATRYWSQGEKVKKGHAYFFREHRHFANEMGHTCDLVVIDPDIGMLVRALKGKIEMTSLTHKPKELGLNRYTVNLYRRAFVNRKPISTQGPYKFKPEIYSLYKSYSHDKAKEQAIDKRQNILSNKMVWAYVVGTVLFITVGGWQGWKFFHRDPAGKAQPEHVAHASSSSTAGAVGSASVVSRAAADYSEKWRYAGEFMAGGERWVVVADAAGRLRVESPSAFSGSGMAIIGRVDGERVTRWSGGAPAPSRASTTAGSTVSVTPQVPK